MGALFTIQVFLFPALALHRSKDFQNIITIVGTLESLKRARERAGFWWVVFAVAMIVLAVSFIVLAIGLYLFIRGR